MALTTYLGSCYCEDVRFEVDADLDSEDVVVCNCGICTMKGILHLIVPPTRFRLLTSRDALTTYTFGTHVAQHTFCKRCGIHPFYTPRSHPDHVDVNVRCLAGVDLATVRLARFDGQNWDESIRALNPGYVAPRR